MHSLLLSFAVTLALAPALACSKAKSPQCQRVCQQETDCAEQKSRDGQNFPYDLDECINACVGLERDKNNRAKVVAHVKCADEVGDDCDALMKCRY